jgi:hypothetical protein
MDTPLRIGVAGYSGRPFDQAEGQRLLVEALDQVVREHPAAAYTLVSGWTDLGIPALAYREAQRRGWRTVGVACPLAREYACFPVDEEHIIGAAWGDESAFFLANIDVLVRVGGGGQALREAAAFRGPKVERELAETPRG